MYLLRQARRKDSPSSCPAVGRPCGRSSTVPFHPSPTITIWYQRSRLPTIHHVSPMASAPELLVNCRACQALQLIKPRRTGVTCFQCTFCTAMICAYPEGTPEAEISAAVAAAEAYCTAQEEAARAQAEAARMQQLVAIQEQLAVAAQQLEEMSIRFSKIDLSNIEHGQWDSAAAAGTAAHTAGTADVEVPTAAVAGAVPPTDTASDAITGAAAGSEPPTAGSTAAAPDTAVTGAAVAGFASIVAQTPAAAPQVAVDVLSTPPTSRGSSWPPRSSSRGSGQRPRSSFRRRAAPFDRQGHRPRRRTSRPRRRTSPRRAPSAPPPLGLLRSVRVALPKTRRGGGRPNGPLGHAALVGRSAHVHQTEGHFPWDAGGDGQVPVDAHVRLVFHGGTMFRHEPD